MQDVKMINYKNKNKKIIKNLKDFQGSFVGMLSFK